MPEQTGKRYEYLDGLRGWAALVVVLNHVLSNFLYPHARFPSIDSLIFPIHLGLDYIQNIGAAFFISLYLFISDGAIAVCLFFALSGYVLSTGFFCSENKMILVNQALRRYPRLTIPVLVSVLLLYAVMTYGGLGNQEAAEIIPSPWIGKFYTFTPDLWQAIKFSLFGVYVSYDQTSSYNFAAWTMGLELAGSFFIFGTLLLCRKNWRWALYAFFIVLCATYCPLGLCLIAGVILAQCFATEPVGPHYKIAKRISLAVAPIIPFSSLLISKISDPRLHSIAQAVTATEILLVVLFSAKAKKILNHSLSRFLGKISFPLYLIHPLIMCSAGSAFAVYSLHHWGEPALGLTAAITVISSIIAARIFYPVEILAVRASRSFSALILNYLKNIRQPVEAL